LKLSGVQSDILTTEKVYYVLLDIDKPMISFV